MVHVIGMYTNAVLLVLSLHCRQLKGFSKLAVNHSRVIKNPYIMLHCTACGTHMQNKVHVPLQANAGLSVAALNHVSEEVNVRSQLCSDA